MKGEKRTSTSSKDYFQLKSLLPSNHAVAIHKIETLFYDVKEGQVGAMERPYTAKVAAIHYLSERTAPFSSILNLLKQH